MDFQSSTAIANVESSKGAYLIVLDDLCYEITWICQVCYNWHPDTQNETVGIFLQQIFDHSLNQTRTLSHTHLHS